MSTRKQVEHIFDRETAVTRVGDNKFRGMVTDSWSIGDAPNGGYLMAFAISAARECVPFRDPLSMTAYYLSKASEEVEMDINVEVLGSSKSTATVQVSLSQQGTLRSRYIGTFGTLSDFKGLSHQTRAAPTLPPCDKCIDANFILRNAMGNDLKIANHIDFRVADNSHFAKSVLCGRQSDTAELECWVAYRDGRRPCLRSLAFLCDALPPPVLILTPSRWIPTLEYTVHFWSRPQQHDAGESSSSISSCSAVFYDNQYWVRGRFITDYACNGLLFTDGEVWGARRNDLLATSRQLARVLTPRAGDKGISNQ